MIGDPTRHLSQHGAFAQLVNDLTLRYGAGEARSIARIVFEDAFGARRNRQKNFTAGEERRFQEIRKRLLDGEPVQYVLGEADFFGFRFKVTPAVLIPRQETEELVAWVLDWLKQYSGMQPAILDIGLGTGCIGISIKAKSPRVHLYGLEISSEALMLATANAERILKGASFNFYSSDILDRNTWAPFPVLDLIVSNPPYIPQGERALVPDHVARWEPHGALFVPDAEPLIFYQAIAEFALEKLRPGGALFFECNEFNAPAVADTISRLGLVRVELRKDLSGADRMVMAIHP